MHLPGSCRACSSNCTAMPCKCLELNSLRVAHATQPLCRCRANARQHGGVNASLTSNAQICAGVPALDGAALKVEPARATRRVGGRRALKHEPAARNLGRVTCQPG